LPNIIRVIKLTGLRLIGHVARISEKRISWRFVVGKYKGMSKLERSKHRWEINIEVGLTERRFEDVDSIDSK